MTIIQTIKRYKDSPGEIDVELARELRATISKSVRSPFGISVNFDNGGSFVNREGVPEPILKVTSGADRLQVKWTVQHRGDEIWQLPVVSMSISTYISTDMAETIVRWTKNYERKLG